MDWFQRLPDYLQVAAYRAGEEAAWSPAYAVRVIEQLTLLGAAICGVEVWLPTHPGPTIPTPFLYTWECERRGQHEGWVAFVERANQAAAAYIAAFQWDARDKEKQRLEPYFNLAVLAPS